MHDDSIVFLRNLKGCWFVITDDARLNCFCGLVCAKQHELTFLLTFCFLTPEKCKKGLQTDNKTCWLMRTAINKTDGGGMIQV